MVGEFGRYGQHHPVKRSLTSLQKRGIGHMVWGIWWVRMTPPRQAELATPPQEGNCRVQVRCDCSSVFVLGISPPQEGNCRLRLGELENASSCTPPCQASPATPPQEGNGLPLQLNRRLFSAFTNSIGYTFLACERTLQ